MQSNLQKISLILSIICLLVFSVGVFFLYREIDLNNMRAKQAIEQAEQEVVRRAQEQLLANSIDTLKADKILLDTHFAYGSDVVPFLNTIEGLATRVGAKAQTTSVDVLKDNSGLLVKVHAAGSFGSLYKFLMLLENSPYELELVTMNLQRMAESEATSTGPTAAPSAKTTEWEGIFELRLLSFMP